jgi:hypothetical protein
VKEGFAGLFSPNARAFTVGNVIDTKGDTVRPSLIEHESTHAWQFQHAGPGYMLSSLIAQILHGARLTGGGAYDYASAIAAKTPWGKFNPEQQAELVEDEIFGKQLFDPAYVKIEQAWASAGGPAAVAQLNFELGALKELQAGTGAAR